MKFPYIKPVAITVACGMAFNGLMAWGMSHGPVAGYSLLASIFGLGLPYYIASMLLYVALGLLIAWLMHSDDTKGTVIYA
jgi:hypothetical protein